MGKYDALTNFLLTCDQDTIRFSFDELNKIISIPSSAYYLRSSWGNTQDPKQQTPFRKGWMQTDYRVVSVNLNEQWVVFQKSQNKKITFNTNPKIQKTSTALPKFTLNKIGDVKDLILLNVPNDIKDLELDQYFMVALNVENSNKIENCIDQNPRYQYKPKEIIEITLNQNKDYSPESLEKIISIIATENSTRTPKTAIKKLARYCSSNIDHFLFCLENGESEIVDELWRFLVNNGENKHKSLASKICRYIEEWHLKKCNFTVNDSVVRKVLPYYLAYYNIDRSIWYNKKLEELDYSEFYKIYSSLREKVGTLNNHQLDHIIWYAYKNDNIRSEIAEALSHYELNN